MQSVSGVRAHGKSFLLKICVFRDTMLLTEPGDAIKGSCANGASENRIIARKTDEDVFNTSRRSDKARGDFRRIAKRRRLIKPITSYFYLNVCLYILHKNTCSCFNHPDRHLCKNLLLHRQCVGQ
jgi:hypothetical protein